MADLFRSRWITFAGCVLVVAVLYWAQAVLVPVCLAVLITFVLTPPVMWLQRRIGRLAAVFSIVILVFTGLGLAGYGVYRQMASLSADLPTYRANIREKIRQVKGAQRGAPVESFEQTLNELKGELNGQPARRGTPTQPIVVTSDQVAGVSSVGWLGPMVEPLGTAGFVITLVLFMLLEREELRDRLIGLFGHGQLATTTKALDEASSRVSRQLLLQTLVNVIYGALAIGGLYLLGVPYPLFWGVLGAALRFVPYLGPIAAAAGPILLSLAALPGWIQPLEVAAFYAALELFTNLVLETVLYAGAAGVTPVALLVAVAFWTWLWGPLGLLMATPLTVCLVVIGKRVPALEFLGTLLSDAPALSEDSRYYQRLLARDQAEAADLVEEFVRNESPEAVYDAVLIPALNFAERDRLAGRLTSEEESAVIDTTREMLDLLADSSPDAPPAGVARSRILGIAVNGAPDELALRMLSQLLTPMPIRLEVPTGRLMTSEVIEQVRGGTFAGVCIADLPPSPPARTRYLVKKLRAAFPDLRIAVCRWAPTSLADATLQPLTDAGASHVSSTALETRTYFAEAAQPLSSDTHAA